MKKILYYFLPMVLFPSVLQAQTGIADTASMAVAAMPSAFSAGNGLQQLTAVAGRSRKFHDSMPPGNYSGITHIGGNRYAVVDDKADSDGFRILQIDIDSITGDIKSVVDEGYISSHLPNRDMEGIAFFPVAGTVFVSGERDNEVFEYALDGSRTGRRLAMPDVFRTAKGGNYGLEALTYNAVTHRFWTTTESTLPADGLQASPTVITANRLRLQSFDDSLNPAAQYFYETDVPVAKGSPSHYAMGVSDLCALDDGRVVVMEREVAVYIGGLPHGFVRCKLYVVNPADGLPHDYARSQSSDLSDDSVGAHVMALPKTLLLQFKTRINLFSRSFANYEGMCLGPVLADGSRVLLLVSDSQNRYRGVLSDWFRTVVIRNG